MSDPRLTPANDRVMADSLPVDGSGRLRVWGRPMVVADPLVDLLRRPGGPRDRQLLLGDDVVVLETRQGMAFVQSAKDDYVGYVPAKALAEPGPPASHMVTVRATHVYTKPDLKSPERCGLSFGARLAVTEKTDAFCETRQGHVPKPHLSPVGTSFDDPVAIAELFLGTPYLWGGNSSAGLDCSGLIQIACLACGIPCPGDSDQQEQALGQPMPAGTPYQRGDIIFWKGHVAWVLDPSDILHANAHKMAVTIENREAAVARILKSGEGPVTSHRRL